MKHLVFFLEEPSAREMLKALLPNILQEHVETQFVVFEGKQDLEKRLPIRLKGWQRPDARFVVMRDQDSGECVSIKQDLLSKCVAAGKPDALVRIACRGLEAFYLGDLDAVARAIGPTNLGSYQRKAKYRNPDALGNPADELKKLAPSYQKVSGSRAIGPLLGKNNNCSSSFNALINGVQNIMRFEP